MYANKLALNYLLLSQAMHLSFCQSNDDAQIRKRQHMFYQCPLWSMYKLLPKYSNFLPYVWTHTNVMTHRFYICKLYMSKMKDRIS